MTVASFKGGNDPLSGMTTKQIWQDCVFISDESTSMKLFLICIGRFFNADGKGCSMSYAQIVADCSMARRTATYCAKRARDHWLVIGVQKGRMTNSGRENLYHAMCPPSLVDKLRQIKGMEQQARAKATPPPPRVVERAAFTVVDNPIEGWPS